MVKDRLALTFALALMLMIQALAMVACGPVQFGTDSTPNPSTVAATDTPTEDVKLRNVTGNLTVPARKVDILFIVDNSMSMEVEQTAMAESFPSFADTLNSSSIGLDWQLGLITTDMNGTGELQDGNLIQLAGMPTGTYLLKSTTPNANEVFKQTVQRPETGYGDERGIYAALRVVQKSGTSQDRGLIRADAQFAIILLSDENVRSVGGTDPSHSDNFELETGDYPDNFINEFRFKFPDKLLSTHAIIIKPGDSACRARQKNPDDLGIGGQYGTVYNEWVNLSNSIFETAGLVGDICNTDYQQQLQDMGDSIQDSLDTFALECAPYLQKITLVSATKPGTTLTLAGDKVKISPPPAEGDVIKFSYQCVEP